MKWITDKYQKMIDNLEWHIRVNKPPLHEVDKLNIQIGYYKEFINDLNTPSPDSYREALDGSEPVLLVFDEKDILTHVGAVESIGQELVFDYAKRGFTILTVSINQYRKLGLTIYKSTCRTALGEKEVGK